MLINVSVNRKKISRSNGAPLNHLGNRQLHVHPNKVNRYYIGVLSTVTATFSQAADMVEGEILVTFEIRSR